MCDIRREGLISAQGYSLSHLGCYCVAEGLGVGCIASAVRNHSSCALLSSYLFSLKWPWVFLLYMVSPVQTVIDSLRALSLG